MGQKTGPNDRPQEVRSTPTADLDDCRIKVGKMPKADMAGGRGNVKVDAGPYQTAAAMGQELSYLEQEDTYTDCSAATRSPQG